MKGKKQIDFLGMSPRNSDLCFIEGELEKWLERHGEAHANYSVQVEKGDPFFRSRIRVKSGDHEWEAAEDGRSLYSSIAHALQHLMEKSPRKEGEDSYVDAI